MQEDIARIYGKRLRVRVCGLLHADERLLLVNHRLESGASWWAPPGGGIEFGETMEQTLQREFLEETNLRITVGQFAFGCEYIHDPLHAIEVFFWVSPLKGILRKGDDPELPLITEVKYMSMHEILSLPLKERHGVFEIARSVKDLQQLKGFYCI